MARLRLGPFRALFAAALAAAGAASATPQDGAQIAARGIAAQSVPACVSCHGMAGQGMAAQGAPRLAHLNGAYLAAQLDAFASGARTNSLMAPIAQHLSAQDKAAVADYFASLPVQAETSVPAPASARGRVLAQQGAWSVQAPACDACHGPAGVGVGASMPPLAGQTGAYLLAQLTHFRDDERHSDPLGLMNGIARRLTPDDLKAAADYYAALPAQPGAKP